MLIINLLPYLFCTKFDEDSRKTPKMRNDLPGGPTHYAKIAKNA